MSNTTKPWYQSRTIWANALAITALILVDAQEWSFMPDDWQGYGAALLGVVNIFLRTITGQAVTVRKK